MIPVTQPYLPERAAYESLIQGIWERKWLTNHGPIALELEKNISNFIGVPSLFLGNGTIALQLAIKALQLKGSIITTPFSYVATTNAIIWENCKPIFADILPETCNIDPASIEDRIDNETVAILATHVYGVPCDVEAIEAIAKKHGLKVIYDAAHAFAVEYKGRSIFSYGDISTASYHATKLFHTIEGGGVFTTNPLYLELMAQLRNFGHKGVDNFVVAGINGKNSEFHAAMGAAMLPDVESIISRRRANSLRYDSNLYGLPITRPAMPEGTEYNYAYYPIFFEAEAQLLNVKAELEKNGVASRRYFYPSLNKLSYLTSSNSCPVSEDIALRALCLPMYPDLTIEQIDMISNIVATALQL